MLVVENKLLFLWQTRKSLAYATAWRLAGEICSPLLFYTNVPLRKNGLILPFSYIHTSLIPFGDTFCRDTICFLMNLSEHPFVLFIIK